jgi:polyisoprenyl-teichoic acid--peptidoglycan teichoic acid transferase
VADTPHHLAARLQAPADLASRECAPAVPARAHSRIASPDPRRGSKTYRKGTWGVHHPSRQQTGSCRRAFGIETTQTADTDRVFPCSSSPRGTELPKPQTRSARIKRRRGLTLLAMTLVLPGSAQLVSGNRRIGRLALRIWASLGFLALLAGLLTLISPKLLLSVITFGPTLTAIQIALITLGVGWAALMLDAWRLGHPQELGRSGQLVFSALGLALAFMIFGSFVAAASMAAAQHDLTTTVFSGGGQQAAEQGRFNILLMGGDAGQDRVGLRPDSMTVASVDTKTGRTVLISLPRNLQSAPFPSYSPLHDRFPRGFHCSDGSCMLNAIYTYASEHRDLYPGVHNPGAQATKEAVEGATGLKINYWVLIDLKGFESLVDSVGGITMDVYRRVPIGGGSTKVHGYVQAGKNRHLNGYEALWFARSRADSSDYDRMVRQKCVMRAMLKQLDPITVLTKFNKIAAASKEVVATDIPPSEIATMMDLAIKARAVPVSSAAMVPPLIHPGAPDYDLIRSTVEKTITKSENVDTRAAEPTPAASPDATPKPKPKPKAKATASPPRGAQTDDLSKACAA